MRHVYRERHEIPRPEGSYINHHNARVFLMDTGNPNKRVTIGEATSETMMHPNDTFRILYPEIWEREYAKYRDPKGLEIHVGMYALMLGSSYKTGIYPLLHEAYGPEYGNAIIDYAMYSILEHTNVTQHFPTRMKDEVLFSRSPLSDSDYSLLFKEKMTPSMHDDFKIEWIKSCIDDGMKKVWLCIDGSNNDCQINDSGYAEPGENKSHTKKPIVGYIYAVDAETGLPVTYFVNPGGMVDSKAFQKIITFCAGYQLEVEGVILDRGFCTKEVVATLRELQLKYVIMCPHNIAGHTATLSELGETVFWNPEYLLNGKDLYGISKEEKIWGIHDDYGVINLFFMSGCGSIKGAKFNEEVTAVFENAKRDCSKGKKPLFSRKMEPLFKLMELPNEKYQVSCNYVEWRKRLHQKGFFSMLSSDDFGPAETSRIYNLRIASEVQYRILKSEEGFDTTRVHTDAGMLSKYAVCFISSVIRHAIMRSCQRVGLDTNDMIKKMDRINLLLIEDGNYKFVRDISQKAADLFSEFDMNMDSFESIAKDYNKRKTSAVNSQIHMMPVHAKIEKRKRGRPLGSKNRKTLEREKAHLETEENESVKKKAGRPPGSKDKQPRKRRSDAGKKRGTRKNS